MFIIYMLERSMGMAVTWFTLLDSALSLLVGSCTNDCTIHKH